MENVYGLHLNPSRPPPDASGQALSKKWEKRIKNAGRDSCATKCKIRTPPLNCYLIGWLGDCVLLRSGQLG